MTTDAIEFPPIDEDQAMPAKAPSTAVAKPLDFEALDLTDIALAKFGDWRGQVALANKSIAGVHFDLQTQAKVDDAKSLRHRLIGIPKADTRKVAKALKSKLAAVSRDVGNGEAEIIESLDAAEAPLTQAIDARQAELDAERAERARLEAERVQRHAAGIETLRSYPAQGSGKTAAQIERAIAALEAIDIGVSWEEYEPAARGAKDASLASLRELHATTKAREDEAERVDAQRIENARIAAEQAAERAALAKQAAELKAEQNRIVDLQARVSELKKAATGHEKATTSQILTAIEYLKSVKIGDNYQEFAPLAKAAQREAIESLVNQHAVALEREEAARAAKRAAETEVAASTTSEQPAVKPVSAPVEAKPEPEPEPTPDAVEAEPAQPNMTNENTHADALRETLREVLDLLWQVRDIWQVMDARALIEKALRQ